MDQFVLVEGWSTPSDTPRANASKQNKLARSLFLILLRVNNFQKLISVDEWFLHPAKSFLVT